MIDRQTARARHLERMREGRIELWRVRGATARQTGAVRAPPRIAPGDDHDEKAAAWLAGYDGQIRRIAS